MPSTESVRREALDLVRTRPDLALDAFRRLATVDQPRADDVFNYGALLARAGQLEHAAVAFEAATCLRPGDIEARSRWGRALLELRRYPEAAIQLTAVLQRAPMHVPTRIGLAWVAERQGRLSDALELLDGADGTLSDPEGLVCYASVCRRLGLASRALPLLRRAVCTEREPQPRVFLAHALAQLEETCGNHARAFEALRLANGLRTERFDADRHDARVDELMRGPRPRTTARLRRDRAVLIVGMPRSGTSLVEQILGCHPDLHAAGELVELPRLAAATRSTGSDLGRLGAAGLDRLALSYHDVLDRLAPRARRVTDKLPHNFLHLGLAATLLPDVRVIHVVRDPLDTCLSCWAQNFYGRHAWSNTFDGLSRYYAAYRRLVAHWEASLGLAWHTVRYEALVADPEPAIRDLVRFVDLPWDARCLKPEARPEAMHTASYAQVRSPIHSRSVGRAERFGAALDPLRDGLGVTRV